MFLESKQPPPILEEKSSVAIGGEFIDPVNNHTGSLGYLAIFQQERTRLLKARGVDFASLANSDGLHAFMIQQSARYKGQSILGDVVDIRTTIEEDGLRLKFHHIMEKDGRIITDADCEYVLVNKDGRPQRIPKTLSERLRQPQAGG